MDRETKNWYFSLITEIFRDQYVVPSIEWTALPAKVSEIEAQAFVLKKRQAESLEAEDPTDHHDLHFFYRPAPDYEFTPFEVEASILEDLMNSYHGERLIKSGRELRKGLLGLKWTLGNSGCIVPKRIQNKFNERGIYIESFPLTRPKVKHIAVQAFAQVIAHDMGCEKPSLIKDRILDCDQDEGVLMHLCDWRSIASPSSEEEGALDKDQARTIQRLITSTLSNSDKTRIEVPGIFEKRENVLKINFGILEVTIYLIARLLSHRGLSLEGILNHPIIQQYKDQVPKFPYHSIAFFGWIKEGIRDRVEFLSRRK